MDFTAKVDVVHYGEFTEEDTVNPNFALTLTKDSGRTTGSFSVSAYRETRTDSAVNLRTSSLNYPVSLSLRYPLDDKFLPHLRQYRFSCSATMRMMPRW